MKGFMLDKSIFHMRNNIDIKRMSKCLLYPINTPFLDQDGNLYKYSKTFFRYKWIKISNLKKEIWG